MNIGRIFERDYQCEPTVKLMLAVEGERPFGCYSLHFRSVQEMTQVVLGDFSNSEDFDAVSEFISEAGRAKGNPVLLPGSSRAWLELVRKNQARLGEHSRRVDLAIS